MSLRPWYNVVTRRENLRVGKPLEATEFAARLDQVHEGSAPADNPKAARFFERTSGEKRVGLHRKTSLASLKDARLEPEALTSKRPFN